ncbi:KRAB-A domain-containing protein 2-like protein [Aphelenchoides avenae]|nr:KRAB-A domain-containing protein 2-like protein [Aphelenchus avenae]
MVYQDHLTKFVVLRALVRKTAIEVAGKLKEIFAVFGAPRILQSDNGKEFANQVVKELVRQWPECRIVHGKPRHSQSQGSVERANRDVGDMLTMYLKDKKTTHWAAALPVIQAAKNRRFHRGINMSPFEAMFGKRMVLGSEDMEIPSNEMRGLPSNGEDLEPEPFIDLNGEDWVTDVEDRYIPSEDKENSSEERSACDSDDEVDLSEAAQLHHRAMRIVQQREGARAGQKRQAESMLLSSAKRYAPVEVGTSVRVPVPDVDRSKIDHRNVMGVVVSVEDGGLYKIGTSTGVLDRSYARNQFDPCAQSFLMVDDIPQKEVALRTAAGAESLGGTQGMFHCMCTADCRTARCKCVRAGRACGSRCHKSNTCANKTQDSHDSPARAADEDMQPGTST